METIRSSLVSPAALTRSQGGVTFRSVRSAAAAVEDFSLTAEYCWSVGITVHIIQLIICKGQWVTMAGMASLSLCCSWLMLFLLVFLVKVCVQTQLWSRLVQNNGCRNHWFADLVKNNCEVSSRKKEIAFKVNNWDWKVSENVFQAVEVKTDKL